MPPYINIHTHRPEAGTVSILNIRLSGSVPDLPEQGVYSAGIHPWDASEAKADWLEIFAADTPPGLVAIGETGLDFRPEYRPFETQKEWFERQVGIANRIYKPLIIHNVHATQAVMEILSKDAAVPVILHGYTGSPESTRQWLRHIPEVRFSFGPTLMRSPKSQNTFRFLSAEKPERIFLETDDDPDTGIREMYRYAAELTDWNPNDLKNHLALNFSKLFPDIILP